MANLIGVDTLLTSIKALRGAGSNVELINLSAVDALRIATDLAAKVTDVEVSFADPTNANGMVFRLVGVPVHKVDELPIGAIDVRCT